MNHTIQNSYLSVTVAEQGAQMQSILGADGTEYLWQGDPQYWRNRAINIFPYVARLTDGCYSMDGQKYYMERHGFASHMAFALAEKTEDTMVFSLEDSEKTRESYPRRFCFQIIYHLVENRLEITFRVENRDEKTMYFGIGGHPGFNVPLEAGKDFTSYRLRFAESCQPKRVLFSPSCFVSGETEDYPLENGTVIPLEHALFDDDAIVLQDAAKTVTLECRDGGHSVTVSYPGMDYVGFWHKPESDAPFVCIEPWCSLPATDGKLTVFEEQKDLIHLEAGKTCSNTWTVTVK